MAAYNVYAQNWRKQQMKKKRRNKKYKLYWNIVAKESEREKNAHNGIQLIECPIS